MRNEKGEISTDTAGEKKLQKSIMNSYTPTNLMT